MQKILIVEDDEDIALLEKDYLEMNGYEVSIAADGRKALDVLRQEEFQLLLLDLMLPGMSGYEICKRVREQMEIPILMVTAKTETIDKIRGLGLGADDYIVKPFDPAELVARVNAHLKRYQRLTHQTGEENAQEMQASNRIHIGDVEIELQSCKVYRGGEEIKLPHREFELLKFLAMNPNTVFSRDFLFEKIWGFDYVGDSATVTVHINRIREKLEEDPKNPQMIETVWGAGYRLNL